MSRVTRQWRLFDRSTDEPLDALVVRSAVPRYTLFDLSRPPPNMGPGTEWRLAPFELGAVTEPVA